MTSTLLHSRWVSGLKTQWMRTTFVCSKVIYAFGQNLRSDPIMGTIFTQFLKDGLAPKQWFRYRTLIQVSRGPVLSGYIGQLLILCNLQIRNCGNAEMRCHLGLKFIWMHLVLRSRKCVFKCDRCANFEPTYLLRAGPHTARGPGRARMRLDDKTDHSSSIRS